MSAVQQGLARASATGRDIHGILLAMKFRATLETHGKTATGVEVPEEIVTALGSKRPKVTVTIGDYTYRSSVASMGGVFLLGLSAEVRAATGVKAGDELEIDLELDTQEREVTVPPDLAAALAAVPAAQAFFDGLTYSNKRRLVLAIDGAKTAETRQRRIDKTVSGLSEGRA
ncbi:MAG: YdeI/OmpD-associated family protein [Propionibacteriaceae bacterium]